MKWKISIFFNFFPFFSIFLYFFIISHFFLIKASLDMKMGICFLEKKCPRISENYFLPSLRAKLLITVWDETPCTWNSFKNPILLHQDFLNITMCSKSFTSDILHFRERERKGQKRPKAFSYLSVLVSNICKLQDFILVNFLLSIKKKIDVWYDDNKCNYGDAWRRDNVYIRVCFLSVSIHGF